MPFCALPTYVLVQNSYDCGCNIKNTTVPSITNLALQWSLAFIALGVTLMGFRSWYYNAPIELRAFYAAGRVVLNHQDAYYTEPLFSIERLIAGPGNLLTSADPVPLPPYDLFALSLLASFPPHVATFVLASLTLIALLAMSYAVSRMTSLPLPLAFTTASCGIVYPVLSIGQITPIAIAGIALAAWFVRRSQPIVASICVGVAFVQPQFAIPSVLSCLLFVPRMRLT